jgi:ATP-dependent Clp protease ATP-binding subunit ClpC
VGAGSAEGAMDASNIIKPALSRGEMQCIGATTLNEFRKYIEKDSALERRFQQVIVNAPTVEETIEILKGIRPKYEEHHKAVFPDEALEAATKLSDRYLPSRQLPDKAIDVMDEAGARARIAATVRPPDFKRMEVDIDKLRLDKEAAIKAQHFEEAAALRDREKEAKAHLDELIAKWKTSRQETIVNVTVDDIYHIMSKWTGVPLQRMGEEESKRLLRVAEELRGKVVGQDEAVESLGRALRRSRADLKDPKRPIGSFAFLGPTGVGKTLLAKTLAEFVFGSAEALIQVDMSEYMEKFNVSRLVGSPPGYVGHDEGGQLTERVRRKPYSVVLFDEMEKAHPDVWNILLQILEDGTITDSLGRRVDFRNTIIIMTSNIGADLIKKNSTLGFGVKESSLNYEQMKEKILEEAKRVMKPEFINRLDDLVVFRSLQKEDMTRIVDLEVEKLIQRLRYKEIALELSDKAKEFLIEKGYDPQYGARPLRRAVSKYLEDPLAEEILKGVVKPTSVVKADLAGDALTFTAVNPPPVEIPASEEPSASGNA